jgi:hypothetical protein
MSSTVSWTIVQQRRGFSGKNTSCQMPSVSKLGMAWSSPMRDPLTSTEPARHQRRSSALLGRPRRSKLCGSHGYPLRNASAVMGGV